MRGRYKERLRGKEMEGGRASNELYVAGRGGEELLHFPFLPRRRAAAAFASPPQKRHRFLEAASFPGDPAGAPFAGRAAASP